MPEEINFQKHTTAAETERSAGRHASPSTPEPANKSPLGTVLIALLITGALALGYFLFGPHQQATKVKAKAVPVTVAIAKTETVPIEIRTTGNILAYSSVNIIPQVSGMLSKVYFTQGQNVKKGDLLCLIDPRPYQASLDQALGNVEKDQANIQAAVANMARDQATVGQLRANLNKDEASLRYADVEAKRYKHLVQQGAISMEQADQTVTNDATATAQIDADKKQIENEEAVVNSDKAQIDTAKGTLAADQAVAENAKIQLAWCTIRAPIDGRTGQLQIYEGNVVAANSTTPIVNIAQVQPIYVQFTIPEEYLDQVRRCLANNTLRIQALIEGVATDYVQGSASFLDNTVNTTSGTALLRASFSNSDSRLYPGQFVDVLVTMPPPAPSVVVPAAAIQTTQKGNAVYVVQADNTVQLKQVDVARSTDEFAAITSGINAGDTVVTDGQLQLTPGVTVKIVTNRGSGSGGSHKHAAGNSPDANFNPNSAGGDGNSGADSNSTYNPLPTGSGASGSAWNANPGYGSQQAAPAAPPPGVGTPLPPAANGDSQPFNPATNGGKPFRAPAPTGGASTTGGAFQPLAGATRHEAPAGGGWHHRH